MAFEQEPRADNSLRGKSLKRASSGELPKTLTAYEWERWYAEHGVPMEHSLAPPEEKRTIWWRRILRLRDPSK